MHQVSLLGGLGNQHADGSHFLRPDRVYRTGVLAPMTGFRPGEAVMAVSQDFTQGPARGMQLSGLRGGLFSRARAWWQEVKARATQGRAPAIAVQASAQAQLPATTGHASVHIPQGQAHGYWAKHGYVAPMAAYGETYGPASHLPAALTSRAYGQSPSLPSYAAEAASKTTMMRWRGLRWPWG